MCGIAGYIGKTDYGNSNQMQAELKRRGPDQDGIFNFNEGSLVHTRLSVIDPEHGLQPMSDKTKRYTIVYNGELYNTPELRVELQSKGHKFYEHSDTEVLLHAYIEWQEKCSEHLNGIFAFAVWDDKLKRLYISRDRMGVKPFFYALRKGKFIFGSEIKAILRSGSVSPEIDSSGLAELFLLGPGRTPGCGVFKGIFDLLPAQCGIFENGKLRLWSYWNVADKIHSDNLETTIEKVRFLVTDSIKRQTVSDVPLCCFLSGGLDSSIISAVAAREVTSPLHTYSIDYKDNDKYFTKSNFQPNSDSEFTPLISKYLGTVHHNIIIEIPELVDALYTAVDAIDLPHMADVDSSLLLFCKEVKKNFTVALSGECSDEIFGGYPWFWNMPVTGFPWSKNIDYRASFLKDGILTKQNSYINNTSVNTYKEMTNLNRNWFMQTLLDRKDRMSMYNGREVRVPFCDYRIVEYLYNIPWEWINLKTREKGLLREAVTGLLPEEILWRKKSPFPKTHNPEYLKLVSERLLDIISNPNAKILDYIKKEKLTELLSNSAENIPWYGQLMNVPSTIAYFVQFDYWLRRYGVKFTD
ncbi:MAG: asparagine synthase (glutamine-hydrolyzing) [Ruminococcus sp.]|jgi:asparagine synthase (glutamine-hydrolysing)|nr:asparagine synthase (glutamine-hydrolyzing) [Ruminococcus sp.]